MIVRRITAGAAAVALAGTAFAAAPAMAKSNTTTLTLDAALVGALGPAGVKPSAVKPAKLKGAKLTIPASMKGSTISHKGGLKLTSASGFVTVQDIKINTKNGKATAGVNNSLTNGVITIKNILTFKGGKNTIKKNGKWTGATVALAKSVTIDNPPLGEQDPAALLGQVLGLPTPLPTGLKLGKATIIVKK